MAQIRDLRAHLAVRTVCWIAVWSFPIGIVHGQVDRSQIEKRYGMTVSEALMKLKAGKHNVLDIDLISQTRAADAIPDLRVQFSRSQDPLVKARIAEALVRLGDKNSAYWEFLFEPAKVAVESDAPDFFNYDGQGKAQAGLSLSFVAWADAHGDLAKMTQEVVYVNPSKLAMLASTGDRREIPLLRKALLSPNPLMKSIAAQGLAEVQDEEAIPLIIDAVQKSPADAATQLASALVYFDDPRAQLAVNTYVPKESAKILRDAKAKGKRPYHDELSSTK